MYQKHFPFAVLLFSLFFFTRCQESDIVPNPNPPVVVNYSCDEQSQACDLLQSSNQFGFEIFKKLHEEQVDQNIFISPLSISTALSMTLNGANGQTKTQMHNTMELGDLSLEEVNNAYQYILAGLPNLDNDTELKLANSIWHDLDFAAHTSFLDVNTTFYNSEVNGLDFKDPNSVDVINNWASDHTNGLIDEILMQIPAGAVMYLINAIYFKGNWRFPFDSEQTITADFFVTPDQTTSMERMSFGGEVVLPYLQNDLFQAVDLPYGDSIYSMTVFLPHTNSSLDNVVAAMETAAYNEWINTFAVKRMHFFMPKFKMKYEKKLNDVLIALGMEDAFDGGKADFSNLGPLGLYISMVKHDAFVEVNEEGTEAAAVTTVEVSETSVGLYVDLNRPFLFVIRENKTNSVLFMGKMMNPNE